MIEEELPSDVIGPGYQLDEVDVPRDTRSRVVLAAPRLSVLARLTKDRHARPHLPATDVVDRKACQRSSVRHGVTDLDRAAARRLERLVERRDAMSTLDVTDVHRR